MRFLADMGVEDLLWIAAGLATLGSCVYLICTRCRHRILMILPALLTGLPGILHAGCRNGPGAHGWETYYSPPDTHEE